LASDRSATAGCTGSGVVRRSAQRRLEGGRSSLATFWNSRAVGELSIATSGSSMNEAHDQPARTMLAPTPDACSVRPHLRRNHAIHTAIVALNIQSRMCRRTCSRRGRVSLHQSRRQIARDTGTDRDTVGRYINAAKEAGLVPEESRTPSSYVVNHSKNLTYPTAHFRGRGPENQ